ncbi:MAG: hypothetical protein QM724_04590 [Flavobacteriales bacterium]
MTERTTLPKRLLAMGMAGLLIGQTLLPTVAYALSTGPSQPEAQDFQAASANDLVDLFSGDFSYNIPLLDVEGYPVNLFYRGGISMDQEASWVGLGWNLNPGSVDRNLRGLPDDFNGGTDDRIRREVGLRPNRTYGLSLGLGLESFGFSIGRFGASPSLTLSPSFNNYDGVQFETGLSLSMRSTLRNGFAATCNLGLTSHSNQALRLQTTIGFDKEFMGCENKTRPGLNFGLSLDGRQGLTNTSFGATVKVTRCTNSTYGRGLQVGTSFSVGAPTYTPQISLPMSNFSASLHITGGLAFWGIHPNTTLGAFYTSQKLRNNTIERPAYGYLHLHEGESDRNGLLDFNREKDGPYSSDISGLSIANLTYDLFSVTGQGVSGSYRAFRSEIGHVFDAATSSDGSGVSAGGELGVSMLAHGGADVMVNNSTSTSGDWTTGNAAAAKLRYKRLSDHADLEPVFFREANEPTVEQDSSLWVSMHRAEPMGFGLKDAGAFNCELSSALTNDWRTTYSLPATNFRTKREPRAQVFSFLPHKEAANLALSYPPTHAHLAHVPGGHMSEITVLAQDGQRYVYGVPVYNLYQDDVEFNVGPIGNDDPNTPDPITHMVAYDATDISTDNKRGRDHFYSRSHTPAYAHAFLLTAVVSSDYSDTDGNRGPTDGDLGNWTRFNYSIDRLYHWRTPVCGTTYRARYSRGLGGTKLDDKASYVCGAKQVRYLRTIESRNFIAVFSTSVRSDALGVSEIGEVMTSDVLERLDSISLYEKTAYLADPEHAEPIKRVHFEYDYSLCLGTPNSIATDSGKLTLKKLWFTYGRSNLGRSTPYVFHYGTPNPGYDMNAQDRWGGLKPNSYGDNVCTTFRFGPGDACAVLRTDEFPYAEQDPAKADPMAYAWCMDTVALPTGGIISISYEADDYATVQDRPAMRMFRICGTNTLGPGHLEPSDTSSTVPTADINAPYVYFKNPQDLAGMSPGDLERELVKGIQDLYFRNDVETLQEGVHDFVSGYAAHSGAASGIESSGVIAGQLGWIKLRPIPIDGDEDGCGDCVSPFYRSALEFIQANYGDRIFGTFPHLDDDQDPARDFFRNAVGSVAGLIDGIGQFFEGPNKEMRSKPYCKRLYKQRSYIRLNEPDHSKKGGGHRVRSIRFADNWAAMGELRTGESGDLWTGLCLWG